MKELIVSVIITVLYLTVSFGVLCLMYGRGIEWSLRAYEQCVCVYEHEQSSNLSCKWQAFHKIQLVSSKYFIHFSLSGNPLLLKGLKGNIVFRQVIWLRHVHMQNRAYQQTGQGLITVQSVP